MTATQTTPRSCRKFVPEAHRNRMRELIRTNDAVLVSAVVALLESAGIRPMVFDQNMSVLEGSLGVLPRRVLVAEDHELRARKLLEDAGLGHELRPYGNR